MSILKNLVIDGMHDDFSFFMVPEGKWIEIVSIHDFSYNNGHGGLFYSGGEVLKVLPVVLDGNGSSFSSSSVLEVGDILMSRSHILGGSAYILYFENENGDD